MSKTLVIGGAGYIGGALTNINGDLHVADNLLFEDRYLKPVNFTYLDVRDLKVLDSIVHNYNTLIVLAGLVGDPACTVDEQLTYDINVKHIKWLAENYRGKIIYTSSCSVYGKNDNLIDETAQPNPLSIYAETKLIAEEYLLNYKPDSLIFRLGTLYGIGDHYSRPRLDLVVNVLTLRAAKGLPLKVFGGDQWRPIINVHDVAEGILYGMDNNLSGVYNLAEKNVTIAQLAETINKVVPDIEIFYEDILFEDRRNYKVKTDKILATGWEPFYNLEQGIKKLYKTFKENRLKDVDNIIYHNGNFIKKYYE